MNRVTWSLVALAGACGGSPTPRPARLDPATAASLTARLAGGHDRFCPDGACTGLLDAAGVCKACGRTDVGN